MVKVIDLCRCQQQKPRVAAERLPSEKVMLSCTRRHISRAKMSSKVQEMQYKFKMREKAELGLIFVSLCRSLVRLVGCEVTREQSRSSILRPFCVEFVCSACACVASHKEDMLWGLYNNLPGS